MLHEAMVGESQVWIFPKPDGGYTVAQEKPKNVPITKPVIFISNYARNRANMATEGVGRRVRISRSHDRWGRCDAKIMELAPSRELVTDFKAGISEEEYTRRFWKELDPVWQTAIDKLEPGDCLLCFCGKGKFCHRYLVADRLKKEGFTVVEI